MFKWIKKLFTKKTKKVSGGFFLSLIKNAFSNTDKEHLEEEIKKILYQADISTEIVDDLLKKLKKATNYDEAKIILTDVLSSFLKPYEGKIEADKKPYIIMLCGVNGVGKTTVAARLAYYFTKVKNQKVMLVAADTFRAAAIEQLGEWSNRIGCEFYSKHSGADPGAVAYEALQKAANMPELDVVIVDTGGRLHTKEGLMNEIGKTQKVMSKVIPDAPHKVLLVIDATQGQNVYRQSEVFSKFLSLGGIVLTKMDGTAKGGVLFKVLKELKLPVFFIGMGESMTDLVEFDANEFIKKLW